MPSAYVPDGLHPNEEGTRELALNLNAQMGFSPIVYAIARCPSLVIDVWGLHPSSTIDVYWGVGEGTASVIPPHSSGVHNGCEGRSLMLTPYGKVSTAADGDGRLAALDQRQRAVRRGAARA